MKLDKWAENEVKLACKRENPNWDEKSFDYGCSCYHSALKAYKSLLEDEHSGFSFSVTKNILDRLMNSLPLTAITEDDFKDVEPTSFNYGKFQQYQCPRYSSLFKYVEGNEVSYSDINRTVFCDAKGHFWCSGLADRLVNELYPITFPYMPTVNKYKVYGFDCMYSEEKGIYEEPGSYNLKYLDCCITPGCDKVKLDKLYLEDKNGSMQEVSGKLKNKILKLYEKSSLKKS